MAILTGLVGVVAAAWIYLAVVVPRTMHISMTVHAMQSMVRVRPWTAGEFALRVLMWAVMMIAMMVPTATPMTLVYAAIARKATAQGTPVTPTFVFVAGYVAMWSLFAVAATGAQRVLDHLALLSPTIVSRSPLLGGVLLVAAGVYQLTPYKRACLANCRSPAHFIAQHWRSGVVGAFRMGLEHGAYCLGCCWILMGLLFVGGVMNLLWVAAIALFVLVEKTIPFGETGARLAGAVMIAIGALSLAGLVTLG